MHLNEYHCRLGIIVLESQQLLPSRNWRNLSEVKPNKFQGDDNRVVVFLVDSRCIAYQEINTWTTNNYEIYIVIRLKFCHTLLLPPFTIWTLAPSREQKFILQESRKKNYSCKILHDGFILARKS